MPTPMILGAALSQLEAVTGNTSGPAWRASSPRRPTVNDEGDARAGLDTRQVRVHQPERDPTSYPTPQHCGGESLDRSAQLRFDPSVPQPARVYNYWLGGKDHYPADREAADEVIRRRPQVVAGARANRDFLARVVRHLTDELGIRQFLDIGGGLPAPDNTHEIAQRQAPECRVVYVDNDPVVLAHARALLISDPRGACAYIDADLRDATAILAEAADTLDFSQPIGVLFLAVLHLIPDEEDPRRIIAAFADGLAAGSCIAISHLTADLAPAGVAAAVKAHNALAPLPVTARTHAEVSALFAGLSLVPPGVVPITEWRASPGDPLPQPADLHAGVGRIPA